MWITIYYFSCFDLYPPIFCCLFVEPIYFDEIFYKTVEFHLDIFVLCQWCVEVKVFEISVINFFLRVEITLLSNNFTVSKLVVGVQQFPGYIISPC